MSDEFVMPSLCTSPAERSRKAHSAVLRALGTSGKQGAIAAAMGTSDTKVSRIKTEQLEDAIALLYHAGFKVVPADFQCVPEVQLRAWLDSHQREMNRMAETKNLWSEE